MYSVGASSRSETTTRPDRINQNVVSDDFQNGARNVNSMPEFITTCPPSNQDGSNIAGHPPSR